MCPLNDVSLERVSLDRCVPWTMRHLDEASSYDPSLMGGGGGWEGSYNVYMTNQFQTIFVTDLLDVVK